MMTAAPGAAAASVSVYANAADPVTGSTVTSVRGLALGCVNTTQAASCVLRLASGVSAEVFVNLSVQSAGNVTATASVVYEGTDPDCAKDSATMSTTANAPPPPPSSGGGGSGGGGGSLDWLALALALALLAGARVVRYACFVGANGRLRSRAGTAGFANEAGRLLVGRVLRPVFRGNVPDEVSQIGHSWHELKMS